MASPKIKIAMLFDILMFNGSLKLAGTPSRQAAGTQYYKKNQDLNAYLGPNWHFRGINSNGDYEYVLKETFDFCIRERRPFKEFMPSLASAPTCTTTNTGHSLCINFTCEHDNASTFGKDNNIFV